MSLGHSLLQNGRKLIKLCWAQSLSHVRLFETPGTVACQATLCREFSRQEYCSGLPFPPPGDLPDPGLKPASPVSPALAGRFFATVPPGKPQVNHASFAQFKRLC